MLSTPIEMVRASVLSFDILCTQNEVPINLSNGVLYFTAKWAPTDSDASVVFQKSSPSSGITFLSAPDGTANIKISKIDTGILPYHDTLLYYDIKFIDATSEPFTLMRGQLLVLYNITRT